MNSKADAVGLVCGYLLKTQRLETFLRPITFLPPHPSMSLDCRQEWLHSFIVFPTVIRLCVVGFLSSSFFTFSASAKDEKDRLLSSRPSANLSRNRLGPSTRN